MNVVRVVIGGAGWPRIKHAWPGAWLCSAFRREPDCPHLASTLIVEAVAVTHWYRLATDKSAWCTRHEPDLGMVTFVDAGKVRHKRDPGRCFLRAGFVPAMPRTTKAGQIALQLLREAMPAAMVPQPAAPLAQLSLGTEWVREATAFGRGGTEA